MAIVIDPATQHQTIAGFGASITSLERMSQADVDFWFGPVGPDLSLTRINLGEDGYIPSAPYTTQWGTIPGADLLNATDVAARGIPMFMLGQMVPAAFRETIDNDGNPYERLNPLHYADWAARYRTGIDQATANGITLCGVSPMNECDEFSEYGLHFTYYELYDFVHNHLKPQIALSTQPTLPIILSGFAHWVNPQFYLAEFTSRGHGSDIGIVDGHNYNGLPSGPVGGLPTWATEFSFVDTWDAGMAKGLAVAQQIHACMEAGLSAYLYLLCWQPDWYTIGGALNNCGLSGQYTAGRPASKRLYVMSHWSKFVRPGASRVACVGAPAGVLATSYQNTGSSGTETVLVNTNPSPTVVTLNGIGSGTAKVYVTDATRNLSVEYSAPVADSLTYTLPANSVTTISVHLPLSVQTTQRLGGTVLLSGNRPLRGVLTVIVEEM